LSSKGLQLALQQQQPPLQKVEPPGLRFIQDNDAWFSAQSCPFFINILQLFWRYIGASSRMPPEIAQFIGAAALAGEREWQSHVSPSGPRRWQPVPVIEHLKMKKAKVCDASACIALIIS